MGFLRNIGPLEIILILVIILIVFGVGKLPEIGSGVGKAIKEFRNSVGSDKKNDDSLFSSFPNKIKSLQWHSYEVNNLESNKDVTILASSPITKYQLFKYQNHAYGIQFHIEIKDTTVNEWGCVPEYKSALEKQLGEGALEKFDKEAKSNMSQMNNYSKILYSNFKKLI